MISTKTFQKLYNVKKLETLRLSARRYQFWSELSQKNLYYAEKLWNFPISLPRRRILYLPINIAILIYFFKDIIICLFGVVIRCLCRIFTKAIQKIYLHGPKIVKIFVIIFLQIEMVTKNNLSIFLDQRRIGNYRNTWTSLIFFEIYLLSAFLILY